MTRVPASASPTTHAEGRRPADEDDPTELVSVWDLRIDDRTWLDHRWERVVAFEWHHASVTLTTERDGWRQRRRLAADDAVVRRTAFV